MTRVNNKALSAVSGMALAVAGSVPALAAEEGGAAMPQLDFATYPSQLFWLAVTFAALFLVMWKVALPRVGDVIEARDRKISDDLARAENAKKEIDALSEEIDSAMAVARSEAQEVLRKAAEKVAADHEKKRAKIEADIASRTAEAEEAIAAARADAVKGLRAVAEDVAASSVEKLTGSAAKKAELKSALDAVSGKGG